MLCQNLNSLRLNFEVSWLDLGRLADGIVGEKLNVVYVNSEQLSRRNTRLVLVVGLSEEEFYSPNSSSIELVLSSISL